MVKAKNTPSRKAKKILEEEQKRRVETFSKELDKLIKKHRVVLQPRVTITANQIMTHIDIIAIEE